MAVFFGTTRMVGNRWNDQGTILEIPDKGVVIGAVAFAECEFDDCTFNKIQPMLDRNLYAGLMADLNRSRDKVPAAATPS